MSGFQFDTITTASPLELTAPPARLEPRGDDSFEFHLRRSDPPSPAAKSEAPRSAPPPKPDNPDTNSGSPTAATPADKPAPQENSREAQSNDGPETPKDHQPGREGSDKSHPSDGSSVQVADVRQATVLAKEGPAGEAEPASRKAASGVKQTAKAGQSAAPPAIAGSAKSTDQAGASKTDAEGVNGELNVSADVEASKKAVSQLPQQHSASEESARVAAALVKENATKAGRSSDPHAEPQKSATDPAGQPLSKEIDKVSGVASENSSGHREHDAEHSSHNPDQVLASVTAAAESDQAATLAATQQAAVAAATDDSAQVKANSKDSTEISAIRSDSTEGSSTSAGRLPQHLLARATSDHAAAARPLTEADQARFVQRVARAFQTAASQDGELRLRLSPPELGSLRLEVKVQGGVISARIETENSATRSLLLENLPALRERLAEQNIRVEHFDVDLMNRQGGGSSSGLAQDQGRQAAPSEAPARARMANNLVEEPAPPQPARRGVDDGQLNVLV